LNYVLFFACLTMRLIIWVEMPSASATILHVGLLWFTSRTVMQRQALYVRFFPPLTILLTA